MLPQRRGRSRSCNTSNVDQNQQSSQLNRMVIPLQNTLQEDPVCFNNEQLNWIRDYEPRHFQRLDFVHLSDKDFHTIVLTKDLSEPIISYPNRVQGMKLSIRDYNRLSKAAKEALNKDDNQQLLELAQYTVTGNRVQSTCFRHTRNTIVHGIHDKEDIDMIQLGFDSLVRFALPNKADILSHHLKGNSNVNNLEQVANKEGFLQQDLRNMNSKAFCFVKTDTRRADSNDIEGTDVILRYQFYSPGCNGQNWKGIISKACAGIRKTLLRKCRVRGKQENEESVYKVGQAFYHTYSLVLP